MGAVVGMATQLADIAFHCGLRRCSCKFYVAHGHNR